jgi:PBP1b-binding outer membrane lipoprotein LpoB
LKKIFIFVLAIGLLAGCSAQSESSKNVEKTSKSEPKTTETAAKTENTKPESKYPFPSSAPTGNAKLTVSTPAGNSSSGTTPVLFVKPDDAIIQIGADFENFQGDKQTFIYVDKIFNSTEQAGQMTQTSVDIQGDSLKPGVHTVTAVQFENNDPAGKVINFVEAKYEVKESK